MCVIILTKRDGTPFNVTSIQKEDIMEICVQLGHTHPLGVLCYTMMESIILFDSINDMQWATHRAIKAMELCKEAIVIRATGPSSIHIKVYITVVGGEPPKAQFPPSEGDGEPHLPAGNPHPGGQTPHSLQAELGDLTDHELCQLWEDLHQEVALCKLNAPCRSPSLLL